MGVWHGEQELVALDSSGNRKVLSDNVMVNAKVIYRYNAQWVGSFHIKNLMDNDDHSPALGAALTEGVANRGREVLFGLKWLF